MGLRIITQPDSDRGSGIFFGPNGVPYGPGVIWRICDTCGGDGVDYPDADSARECPDCQGLGKKPYERPTHGARGKTLRANER